MMGKIDFGFSGGSLDDKVFSVDTDQWLPENQAHPQPATQYYCHSGQGEVGRRFAVRLDYGFDIYEVERRTENGSNVIVRACHIAFSPSCVDIDEIMFRC